MVMLRMMMSREGKMIDVDVDVEEEEDDDVQEGDVEEED